MRNLILRSEFEIANSPMLNEHQKVEAHVTNDAFLVPITAAPYPPKNIVHVFDDYEAGYMTFMPKGNVRDGILTAHITHDDFKMDMKFVSPGRQLLAQARINTRAYVEEMLDRSGADQSYSDIMGASISCLKRQFQGIIEGNDCFWFRFSEDFSEAIAPVRPIIEISSTQYDGRPFIGMNSDSYHKAIFISTAPNHH